MNCAGATFIGRFDAGRFHTDEKEYALLDTLLGEGNWALDFGTNIGY